jgi:putative FmdB family regulatory protein
MPIYEYRCGKCGFQKEFLQRVSDAPLKKCPECGKAALAKLVTAAGFQLKGTGWYATDFKGGGAKADTKADTKKGEPAAAAKDKPATSAGKDSTQAAAPAAAPAPASSAADTSTN